MGQVKIPTQSVQPLPVSTQKQTTIPFLTAAMPPKEIGTDTTGKFMGYFVRNDDIFALFKQTNDNRKLKYGVSTEILRDFMKASGLLSLSGGAPAYTLAHYGLRPTPCPQMSQNFRNIYSLMKNFVLGSLRKDRHTILVHTQKDLVKVLPDLLPLIEAARKELKRNAAPVAQMQMH